MKRYYLLNTGTQEAKLLSGLDHQTIRELLIHEGCGAELLSKDIIEWRDQSQSGDSIQLSSTRRLLALDFERLVIPAAVTLTFGRNQWNEVLSWCLGDIIAIRSERSEPIAVPAGYQAEVTIRIVPKK
jgi:hypothetical protein